MLQEPGEDGPEICRAFANGYCLRLDFPAALSLLALVAAAAFTKIIWQISVAQQARIASAKYAPQPGYAYPVPGMAVPVAPPGYPPIQPPSGLPTPERHTGTDAPGWLATDGLIRNFTLVVTNVAEGLAPEPEPTPSPSPPPTASPSPSPTQPRLTAHRTANPEPARPDDRCRFENTIRLRHSGEVSLGVERLFSPEGMPGYRGDSCRATQQHFVDCLASGHEFETEATDNATHANAPLERVTADAVPAPAGAVVIDGRGQTLMPGLVDPHSHCVLRGERRIAARCNGVRHRNLLAADD